MAQEINRSLLLGIKEVERLLNLLKWIDFSHIAVKLHLPLKKRLKVWIFLICLYINVDFDSSGLTMHKLKGLTLGKQGKGGVFDKSSVRPSVKQSLIISSKNKNRRPKKPPGSLMDMSNDGGDDGAIANGV